MVDEESGKQICPKFYELFGGLSCKSKNAGDIKEALTSQHCGHDSFFEYSDLQYKVIGVVGAGNNSRGIEEQSTDTGQYGRELMAKAHEAAHDRTLTPVQIIDASFQSVTTKAQYEGSATISVIKYDYSTGELLTANLGNNQIMIIRDNRTRFISKPMYHSESRPYQFSSISTLSDSPSDVLVESQAIKDSDVIILGTDGLFKNLDNADIVKIIHKNYAGAIDPFLRSRNKNDLDAGFTRIASKLVLQARERMYGTEMKAKSNRPTGGRSRFGVLDDVTAYVFLVRANY
ncbi:hypothetical protein BKA69DRAFT_1039280 [Paraphysoderma sedebokerense]|nr:hypothetical protein BKA69DRAFT_1141122 [Paraphysoderma sedebokerense]KAI9140407.1 hypothetical protein BKA69DRAFT_1039280 [Paraphysoderma sedebokerense]